MKTLRQVAVGMWIGGWVILALCNAAVAQYAWDESDSKTNSARHEWDQRVLRGGRASAPTAQARPELSDYRYAPRLAYAPSPWRKTASALRPVGAASEDPPGGDGPESIPPGKVQLQPVPDGDEPAAPGGGWTEGPGRVYEGRAYSGRVYGGCGDGIGCAEADECDAYGDCEDDGRCFTGCYPGHRGLLTGWWWSDLSLFAGAHGFKGPVDRGVNGNFGIHEGINFGAPTGLWDVGYQLGFNHIHSDFSGFSFNQQNQTFVSRGGDRHQYVFTGGIFRRALCGGLQWGVVFDFMHDNYYDQADLKQIRSETSLVFPGLRDEIGYFGAYGVGGDQIVNFRLAPTDMFALFYRRHFETGGEGRIWGGATGQGDGLLGGEVTVPLGRSWALENRVNYLIPKQGHGFGGQAQEAWGLTVQLVWYPGRRAACVEQSPFRPMFGVADNTTFMVQALDRQP